MDKALISVLFVALCLQVIVVDAEKKSGMLSWVADGTKYYLNKIMSGPKCKETETVADLEFPPIEPLERVYYTVIRKTYICMDNNVRYTEFYILENSYTPKSDDYKKFSLARRCYDKVTKFSFSCHFIFSTDDYEAYIL